MSSLLRRAEPDTRTGLGDRTVAELGDADRGDLIELVAADPVVNSVLASRLDAIESLSARRFGGTLIGVRDGDGRLRAAAFNGGNLLPVGVDAADLAVLGQHLSRQPRVCSSIVGRAESVRALWTHALPTWGPCRAIRERQPLLVLDSAPLGGQVDERVRLVRNDEIDRYLPAAAAMFTEELGISPFSCVPSGDYRRRVASIIRSNRALAITDDDGEVLFKADLGAISRHTCQVQGVWVRPDLRGAGIGTAAMRAVLHHALTLAPTVSLYVNDYNLAARRMYETVGMRQVATLSTVLF